MTHGNLLLDSIPDSHQELFETLVQTGEVRIERIISTGQSSPEGFWYDQPEHEFVMVLQGAAVIDFEERPSISLEQGTWLHIQPHQRHRVAGTSADSATIWLAIFWKAEEPAKS